MTSDSIVLPNTLNFFFLMSLFILPSVFSIVSLSFRISSSVRFGYDIFYLINKNAIYTWFHISRSVTIRSSYERATEGRRCVSGKKLR